MNTSEKLSHLSRLSEAEFRENLLIPLLRKMGYAEVRERHGTVEYGKDITFVQTTPLGRTYYAIVAKVGDISGAASGRQNLATVKAQVNQAFDIPYHDIDNKRKQVVNQVIVWTSGKISNNAETQVIDSLSQEYRNVNFKDGQTTVELLDEHFPSYFAVGDVLTSDYYAMAKEFYGRIEELRTLGASSERLRLPVIYVPPTLKPYFPRLRDSNLQTRQYSSQDVLASKESFLIIGQMGAGKSTFLRRLLLATIEKNEATGSTSPLPIFVVAKRLDLSKEDCLEIALAGEVARLSPISDGSELLSQALSTSAIVLIDGVDELKDETLILTAFDRIASFAKLHPRIKIIVSSRATDIIDNPAVLSDFNILELQDLSPSQTSLFIENWFGSGNPISVRLTRFLQDPLTLHGLPNTPLTLAIVAILYSNGLRELPANLTELFSKYTELALGRWDEGKDISQQFEWRVKQFLLRRVAWSMHDDRTNTIIPSAFDETITKLGEDRGLTIDAKLFREEVADRSELIVINQDDEYEFKHRAFQDYFTAQEIISRATAIDLVVENFLDQWWEQVIFFACGLRPDTADFLEKIMLSVRPNDADLFKFAVNLGMATQATYLAPRSVKYNSIQRVIDDFIDAYSIMEKELNAAPDRPNLPAPLSWELMLLGIVAVAARQALGSISLAEVLAEIARDHLKTDLNNIPPEQRSRVEWKAFLLATACAASDNANEFVELLESPLVTSPMFRGLSIHAIDELLSHNWLDPKSVSHVKRLRNRLLKSLKKDPKLIPEPLRGKSLNLPRRPRLPRDA